MNNNNNYSNTNALLSKKGYLTGYKHCGRCGEFKLGWQKNPSLCEYCHSKLRSRAKGSHARRLREPYTKRI